MNQGNSTLLLQQILQVGKRGMGGGRAPCRLLGPSAGRFQLPQMLVVMAIQAEKFPVAAVGWIVVVIVVAVMHRQFAQVDAGKFPCATAADPWIYLQRSLAVILIALIG